MAKNGGKSGQVRIAVPEPIREWAKSATMFQRANGQRGVSLMLVMQAIIDRVAESGFVEYLKDVDPEQLKDIRGRPKSRKAA